MGKTPGKDFLIFPKVLLEFPVNKNTPWYPQEPTEMEIIHFLVQNRVINKIIKLSKLLNYKAFEPNNICLISFPFIAYMKRMTRSVYNFLSWQKENSHMNGDMFFLSSLNPFTLRWREWEKECFLTRLPFEIVNEDCVYEVAGRVLIVSTAAVQTTPTIDKFILNKSYDLCSLSPLLLNPNLPSTSTLGLGEFLLEN